ncbi:hypothetical protein BDY24DRAFT_378357 [Mrakia frigida]|uniref:uncharacterized protein n=1 Tax=Mrakia frigida TaxID=29902 RepID=UPI003FCBF4E4
MHLDALSLPFFRFVHLATLQFFSSVRRRRLLIGEEKKLIGVKAETKTQPLCLQIFRSGSPPPPPLLPSLFPGGLSSSFVSLPFVLPLYYILPPTIRRDGNLFPPSHRQPSTPTNLHPSIPPSLPMSFTLLSSKISRVFESTFNPSSSTSSSSSSSSSTSTYNSLDSFPTVSQFGVLTTSAHLPPSTFSHDPSIRFRAKRPSLVAMDLTRKEKSRLRKWEKETWPTLDLQEERAKDQFYTEELAWQAREAGF